MMLLAGVAFLGAGCADLKNGLPPPTEPGAQAHDAEWVNKLSPKFHGATIRNANWDMRSCKTCHGPQYNGGTSNVSCSTCHTASGGVENCATCHGSTNPAPPRDLSGNTARTARGVGAHQVHVVGSPIATFLFCNDCHVVPGPVYAPGHIDDTPNAEVVMNNPLARTRTNRGTDFPLVPGGEIIPTPAYDPTALSCASTYCHGNFKNGNRTFAPVWNDASGSQMACGTCHGNVNATTTYRKALPKTIAEGGTHPDPSGTTTCATATACHVGVIDANFRFPDPSKHINGKLNLGGVEFDF